MRGRFENQNVRCQIDQTVDTVPHMLAKFEVVQGILNGMGYGKYFEEDTRGKLEAILEVENFFFPRHVISIIGSQLSLKK